MHDLNRFSAPINKVAGLVTSQSQSNESEYAILSAKIEDLKLALRANEKCIQAANSKKEKRPFGLRKVQIQEQIIPLKRELKLLNMIRRETMNSLIVRECMKRFSKEDWEIIMASADLKFRRYEP